MVKVFTPQSFARRTTRGFRDPGLAVSPGQFGAGVGRGIAQLGQAGQELSERLLAAEERVRARRDSIGSSGIINEYGAFSQETELEASTRDITGDTELQAIGTAHTAKRQELLDKHQLAGASPDSMVRLELRLDEIGRVATARLGVMSTEQGKAAANASIDRATAPLIKQAQEGAGNIDDLFVLSDSEVNEFKGSIQTIPLQAKIRERRRAIGSAFVVGKLDRAAAAADIDLLDAAEDEMNSTPGLLAALGSAEQTRLRRLFFQTRVAIRDAERDERKKILEVNREEGQTIVDDLGDAFKEGVKAGLNERPGDFLSKPGVVQQILTASQKLETTPEAVLAMIQAQGAGAPSPEQQAEAAALITTAKEGAKITIRTKRLREMFSGAGLPDEEADTLAEDVENGESVTEPFGAGVEATDDAKTVAQLITASRRLLLVGDTTTANALLTQARFLAENSPEIQRGKELDKPISESLAREFGVKVGTPFRDVMNRIPRNPEEVARLGAVARAKGRGQVEAGEQIGFIDEAQGIIRNLLDEVEDDPGIVGIRGSLRATGQTALSVLGELGLNTFVERAREVAFSNTDLSLDEMEGLFSSSTLSVLKLIENSVGLILARLRTPQGRVPVDIIRRSINDVKLTGITGSKQVVNRLEFVFSMLETRKQSVQRRFDLGRKDESGIPRFRVKGGKLQQVK